MSDVLLRIVLQLVVVLLLLLVPQPSSSRGVEVLVSSAGPLPSSEKQQSFEEFEDGGEQ